MKNTKRRLTQNDPGPTPNQDLHEGSIYTTSSMLSLISMPNEFEDNMKMNPVTTV